MQNLIRVISFISLLTMGGLHRSWAQPSDIPHLQERLRQLEAKNNYRTDTSYIDVLDSLAFAHYRINADTLFFYSNKALDLARAVSYGEGETSSLRIKGNGYRLIGDYVNMLSCYHQALVVAESIHHPLAIAKAETNIALFYIEVEKYEDALSMLEDASGIYAHNKDSLNLNKTITSIGDIFRRRQQYEKSLAYLQHALQIAVAMKNKYLIETNNDAIAEIMRVKGQYKEALATYLHSWDYFSHTDDQMRKSVTGIDVARTYYLMHNYTAALKFAQLSLQIATGIKGKVQMRNASEILAEAYEAKGDYKNALFYSRLQKQFSDSIFNQNTRKQTEEMVARYSYEKKEKQLNEEQARKAAITQDLSRKNQAEIFICVLVIIFLITLTIIIFQSRANKQHNNALLEEKNKKIGRQKDELEHIASQLSLNNRQKDMLFGIVAHDLRAPLNSFNEVLALLKEKSISHFEIREIMEELRQDVDYSAELINNLLFWARSQLNGIEPHPVQLPLRELVNDTLILFLKQAVQKNIQIRNKLSPHLYGYADKNMVSLVVRNLLSNAIKFSHPGDLVTIEGTRTDNTIELCIADTGSGIEKETLEKILKKESTSSNGTAKEKGTGLGLLLCREFVLKNNGRFLIESQRGEGSRFYFTLPAGSAESLFNQPISSTG